MNVPLILDLAAHIRSVDGSNQLAPYELGESIALFCRDRGLVTDEATESAIADFAGDQNAGTGYLHPKRVGAAALAELVVEKFQLGQGEEATR